MKFKSSSWIETPMPTAHNCSIPWIDFFWSSIQRPCVSMAAIYLPRTTSSNPFGTYFHILHHHVASVGTVLPLLFNLVQPVLRLNARIVMMRLLQCNGFHFEFDFPQTVLKQIYLPWTLLVSNWKIQITLVCLFYRTEPVLVLYQC